MSHPYLAVVAAVALLVACGDAGRSDVADTGTPAPDSAADIRAFETSDQDTGGEGDTRPDTRGEADGSGGDVSDADWEAWCLPCERSTDCFGAAAVCIELRDGLGCLAPCGDGGACRAGERCETVTRAAGPIDVCVPPDGVCTECEGGAAHNACGGCSILEAAPGDRCGTCGSGTRACDGTDALVCEGDLGGRARNDCGGCGVLEASEGGSCGPCGDGAWVCAGADSLTCEGDTGDTDGDTICDGSDRCPGEDDRDDADADGMPDACDVCPLDARDDSDGDGSCDSDDICPEGDDRPDDDRDTVPDACDRCVEFDDRHDADSDGNPDACDCDTSPCGAGARCVETTTGVQCPCLTGWEVFEAGCREIDECSRGTATCHPTAICTNTPGSYGCACAPGWEGDGRTCTDIDECARRTDACHALATCTDTDGGYTCQCPLGYGGDGFSCVRITSHTFAFPSASDVLTNADDGGRITVAGDRYDGTRTLPLATIAAVTSVAPVVDTNALTAGDGCLGAASFSLRIDGVTFGTLSIASNGTHQFFPDARATPVEGPDYTLELVALVVSCGWLDLSETGTTVTVAPLL